MTDLEKLAMEIEDALVAAIIGPVLKFPQTALRLRGGSFEVVDLDAAGNVIEPPPPCCLSRGGLHAPNCRSWGVT